MTEIATRPASPPALAYNSSALDIGAEDIALPRVKIAQLMTAQVAEGLVVAGQIFASTGEDDAEVLFDPKDKKAEGVLVHVLSVTRGKSASIDGDLFTYSYNDPDAPAEAWVTYNYVICLPEVDADVPYKWLMTRTATRVAKQINMVLARNSAVGPAYESAFRISTVQKKNDKGTFFVPRVTTVPAVADHVEAASKLAAMVAGSVPEQSSVAGGADEPAI